MVMMSYWPPPVAMSVVTRSRRMFSSSVTQFTVMSGCALVNSLVRLCIWIICPLFTVAMVMLCGLAADAKARADAAPANEGDMYACFLRWNPLRANVASWGKRSQQTCHESTRNRAFARASGNCRKSDAVAAG